MSRLVGEDRAILHLTLPMSVQRTAMKRWISMPQQIHDEIWKSIPKERGLWLAEPCSQLDEKNFDNVIPKPQFQVVYHTFFDHIHPYNCSCKISATLPHENFSSLEDASIGLSQDVVWRSSSTWIPLLGLWLKITTKCYIIAFFLSENLQQNNQIFKRLHFALYHEPCLPPMQLLQICCAKQELLNILATADCRVCSFWNLNFKFIFLISLVSLPFPSFLHPLLFPSQTSLRLV